MDGDYMVVFEPPGNGRLTKGQRTRERLLRSAIDRFGVQGFRSTSVSDLSRDAGLSPTAAYAYFEDKEHIWRAAVTADLDAIHADVVLIARGSPRPLIALMRGLLDELPRHPLTRRVLVEGSPDDLDLILHHPIFSRTTMLVAETMRRRQEAGQFDPRQSPEVFALGVETVMFALLLSIVRSGMESDSARVQGVIELVQSAAGGPMQTEEREAAGVTATPRT